MTEAKLNYIGPAPALLTGPSTKKAWWRRLPIGLFLVVILPTLIAAIYYLGIASPIYVSEARFVVKTPGRTQVSSLGVALQGVGITSGPTDSFAVHEFITSRDALNQLQRRLDVAAIIGHRDADFLSRYPRPGESRTEEGLYKALQRFVTVGYDSTTGISTLRVEAFRPNEAKAISEALLAGGESLVNRLNQRSAADAITEASRSQEEARMRLNSVQQQLTAFRNREGFIDPQLAAQESSQLIGGLLATIAQLRAEESQLRAEAPASPQLPTLTGRIAAYEGQVAEERAKLTGGSSSLAPSIGAYQDLILERELADRQLTEATATLVSASQEARRQNLYLERIVEPNLPDKATQPKRWLALLTVFISCLLVYSVGWLIYAGVREHGQA